MRKWWRKVRERLVRRKRQRTPFDGWKGKDAMPDDEGDFVVQVHPEDGNTLKASDEPPDVGRILYEQQRDLDAAFRRRL